MKKIKVKLTENQLYLLIGLVWSHQSELLEEMYDDHEYLFDGHVLEPEFAEYSELMAELKKHDKREVCDEF